MTRSYTGELQKQFLAAQQECGTVGILGPGFPRCLATGRLKRHRSGKEEMT